MNVVIIDGQGGLLGAQLVKEISAQFPDLTLTAVGTNTAATTAMLKAGAKNAATGENPVLVACRKADVIIGPVAIVIADSLLGEITAQMALAVARADATRILIPMNKCENLVAGVGELTMTAMLEDVMLRLSRLLEGHC